MKITSQQLKQIIKEELDKVLNEGFDDPEYMQKNAWQNKEVPPFSRARLFIRSASPDDFNSPDGPVAQSFEIADALLRQMVKDKNLPKHKYMEKVLTYVTKKIESGQQILVWQDFAKHSNVPKQVEKLKETIPNQIKAIELFEKYQETLKLLFFRRDELEKEIEQEMLEEVVMKNKEVDPLKVLAFHNQMSRAMSRGNWLFRPVVYTDTGTGRKDEEANLIADLNAMAIEAGKGNQEKANEYVSTILPFIKDEEYFYTMIG